VEADESLRDIDPSYRNCFYSEETGAMKVSISPTSYKQLLRAQILKAQKGTDGLTFWDLSGSMSIKAAHKTLVKSTQGVNFTNILRAAPSFKRVFKSFSNILCNFSKIRV
jgi:hypothetical protein